MAAVLCSGPDRWPMCVRSDWSPFYVTSSRQVVSEVFCWGREPMAVRKMATKKDEIFTKLLVCTLLVLSVE